jgi:hypothetical protein
MTRAPRGRLLILLLCCGHHRTLWYAECEIVIDPDIPNTLYLATESTLLRSSSGGASWYPIGTGLPVVTVTDAKLHRASRTLRVATAGRGLWDLSVPITAPRLSTVSLSAAASAYTATLTGVNFDANSVVRLNGATWRQHW